MSVLCWVLGTQRGWDGPYFQRFRIHFKTFKDLVFLFILSLKRKQEWNTTWFVLLLFSTSSIEHASHFQPLRKSNRCQVCFTRAEPSARLTFWVQALGTRVNVRQHVSSSDVDGEGSQQRTAPPASERRKSQLPFGNWTGVVVVECCECTKCHQIYSWK